MNIRKVMLCAIALSMVGGASIGANEAYQTLKGKKVRVAINGADVNGGGLQIDGKTYVPLSSDTIQGLMKADASSDNVNIYKPNVHLLTFYGDKNTIKPFGQVKKGINEFSVFAQIDNLLTKIRFIKITIADPDGKTLETQTFKMSDDAGDTIWLITNPIKMDFKTTGQYKVKVSMKQTDDSEYELVSEKAIQSLANN